MTATAPHQTLEDIRRDIDAIDDRILDLLESRIAASGRVREVKSRLPDTPGSPIRPAREAQILRRLMARKSAGVSPQLVVRLWRAILTSSSLAQAAFAVHVPEDVYLSPALRMLIADYFSAIPVKPQPDVAKLLEVLSEHTADIGAVTPSSGWPAGLQHGLQIIGRVPALAEDPVPKLLIVGHCEAQASGDDETVIVGHSAAPSDVQQRLAWTCTSGSHSICGIRGFLTVPPAGWTIAGRYPSSIEVS